MKRKVDSAFIKTASASSQKKIASRNDVARLAGVSPAAVSQVLNNLPNTRIRPAIREKIFSAARKLGYRPNPIAKALAAGKTSIIGVLIFHHGPPFGDYTSNILNASWDGLKRKSYRTLIDSKEITDSITS